MGFVSEELNETEKRSIQQNKVNNMAVVYGKEASMWKVKELDLFLLQEFKKKREKEESSVMQNTAWLTPRFMTSSTDGVCGYIAIFPEFIKKFVVFKLAS